MRTLEERLWGRTIETPEGCWIFQGHLGHNGYGQIGVDGRTRAAHRVAYELAIGPIPAGLVLDHLCRNRACVNPAHLEPVSTHENTMRGQTIPAVNADRTHCPSGHPYSGDNLMLRRGPHGAKRECRACRRLAKKRRRAITSLSQPTPLVADLAHGSVGE